MPTETFFNLPQKKRERFLAASYREFALHNYNQASISRIVSELGIAKGSLYQYFKDKRALYRFLLEQAGTTKLAHIQEEVQMGDEPGFFEYQRQIMISGAKFDLRYPHLSLIIYRAMQDSTDPEQSAIAEELTLRSGEFLQQYVTLAAERQEIRPDIDVKLAAHIVNTLTLSLEPYLKLKYGYSHLQQIAGEDSHTPFTEDQLERDINELVIVMRSGLQPSGASPV